MDVSYCARHVLKDSMKVLGLGYKVLVMKVTFSALDSEISLR